MAEITGLLASRNYSALIKQLDSALVDAPDGAKLQLLLNRGFCLLQLGLYRKALKDYDSVLESEHTHAGALLYKAKVLVALKQRQDAVACLEELSKGAALAGDLAVLLQGQLLATALASGEVKDGAKLALLPALAPLAPPPVAPAAVAAAAAAAPSAVAARSGFASGFLSSPAAAAKPAPTAATTGEAAATAAAAAAAAAPAAVPAAASAAPAAAPAAPAGPSAPSARPGSGGGTRSSSMHGRGPSPRDRAVAARAAAASQLASAAAGRAAAVSEPNAPVDPLNELVARTDANQGVGLAVQMVNSGSCREAVSLLDLLLTHHPGNVGAFAARGTAKALLGRLQDAVDDFSLAIEVEPRFYDFYKRRGQALAALGDDEGAARDLRHAIDLSTDTAAKAENREELGRLYQKAKDYRRAQAEFQEVLSLLGPAGASSDLLSALGLCQVSQGDLTDGIASYERALALSPDSKDLWLNIGMALKEQCVVERAEEALRTAAKLAGGTGPTAVHAFRLLAQMKQGLGDHVGAVKELNRGITATDKEAQRIELRFLRGACHHAIGQHKQAVDDYQQTLEAQGALLPGGSSDLVSFVCLAFYQKEMALYARANLDRHVLSFCPDADLHPEFKELWCKKGPPSADFVSMYRTIMQPQHPNWTAVRPSPPDRQKLVPLLEAADAVGRLVQYSHQGFLPNKRQQRMAGLAAIEFAQALQQMASDRRSGRPTLVPDAGASVSARPGGPPARRTGSSARRESSGKHAFGWRDAMDIIVRWRQLAEPNDQVIWVDLLTEREFNAGFGSHTPMFTGQTKCVRYYMVFGRALALMKRVLAAEGSAQDANNALVPLDSEARKAAVRDAATAGEMWRALGTDSWVVVPIRSTTRPGHTLEGTRLTVVNMSKEPVRAAAGDGEAEAVLQLANGVRGDGAPQVPPKPKPQPDSYEFSIRTPVTPARWVDYDEELEGMFERLAAALAERDTGGAAEAALRFAYYWYNFMPLARGSAFCGYVSMLGAFLAAGAPVCATMPQSYQTDWEAILESSPDRFLESVSSWMYPPELQGQVPASSSGASSNKSGGGGGGSGGSSKGDGGSGGGKESGDKGSSGSGASVMPFDKLPKVIDLLPTMRSRLEALNGPDAPRI